MTKTDKQIKQLALNRMTEILESWWYEGTGELGEYYDLTDEEVDRLLECGWKIEAV